MSLQGKNFPPFMFEGKWGSQRWEPSLVPGRSQWLHRPWDPWGWWAGQKDSLEGNSRMLKPDTLVLCSSSEPRKHSWFYSWITIGTSQDLPSSRGFCARMGDEDVALCSVSASSCHRPPEPSTSQAGAFQGLRTEKRGLELIYNFKIRHYFSYLPPVFPTQVPWMHQFRCSRMTSKAHHTLHRPCFACVSYLYLLCISV